MKKLSIHAPVTETIQYVVEGQQKYPNNKKAQNKEEKADIDQIWQSQAKESVVSLRQVEMQYKVLSLMLQARNMVLLNVGYLKQYVFLLLINYKFYCYWLQRRPMEA